MYGLDINFLKDRPEYSGSAAGAAGAMGRAGGGRSGGRSGGGRSGGGASSASASNRPLIIGAALGLGALGLSALAYAGFLFQGKALTDEIAEVDVQVGDLEKKEAELKRAQTELTSSKDEITALTSVFSNIKPWSAMSQDLRDRLPQGVQITEIAQEVKQPVASAPTTASTAAKQPGAAPDPAAPPAVAPPPLGVIKISGLADNFDKVNDFLVVLQKSNFLDPQATRIVTSELQTPSQMQSLDLPGPDGTPLPNQGKPTKLPKMPPKVSFAIQTSLADVPTSELLRELDRKGAVGLVSRIEALKEKGVIKP
jgi:type IV pilus assembly protein PilN